MPYAGASMLVVLQLLRMKGNASLVGVESGVAGLMVFTAAGHVKNCKEMANMLAALR